MKKRKENKNDKLIIFAVLFIVFALFSWIFKAKSYQSGILVDLGMYRAGLYDLLAVVFAGITYDIETVFYILVVGGIYGVLSKTNVYKNAVNALSEAVKGQAYVFFAIVTLLVGLYTSFSNDIMTLFFIVPFIMSIFIKAGHDKLTAVSASFGGLFLGYLGQTLGTYGCSFLYEYLNISVANGILTKVILFLFAYVLFNLFAMLHMYKNKNTQEQESDMFEIVEEKSVSRKKSVAVQVIMWVAGIVGLLLSLLIVFLGYIPWEEAFGLEIFNTLHDFVFGLKIGEIEVFSTIFGTTITALGTWENFLPIMLLLLIDTFIIALCNKVSINEIIEGFADGVKKILKVAIVYGLAFSFLYLSTSYPWPTSIVDKFLNPETYNVINILLAAIISVVLCAEPLFSGYYYGTYLSTIYAANAVSTAILWRVGSAIALLVGPTSFLLLMALVYADIPYTKWLKYIWKFVLSFMLVTLIVMAVVVYI